MTTKEGDIEAWKKLWLFALLIQLKAWDEGDITTIAAVQAVHDADQQLKEIP